MVTTGAFFFGVVFGAVCLFLASKIFPVVKEFLQK